MFRKEKIISFVVPCYNCDSYMERCINTLLKGKEDVEIILVNDGSTDNTLKIANGYKKRYPKIIKVIDKEHNGIGKTILTGLNVCSGKYFKVVDSDDWLDEEALQKLIYRLKTLMQRKKEIDVIICNYIYDHLYDGYKKNMSFHNIFIDGKVIDWERTAGFKSSQYLIMHSLIYKTELIKKSKIDLPKNTYYVDNLVSFLPLQYTKKLCYFDLDLYHYFIGREDQTISEDVMAMNIDDQIKITKILIDNFEYDMTEDVSVKLNKYLLSYLSVMVSICNIYLTMLGDKNSLAKKEELWEYAKLKDERIYKALRKNIVSRLSNLPGDFGNKLSLSGYKIAKKIFKFN